MASPFFLGFIALLVASLTASQECLAPLKRVQPTIIPSNNQWRDMSVNSVKGGINGFTANFMKEASTNDAKSFISSPLSVWLILAMLAFGARGETYRQFHNTLQFPVDNRTPIGIQTLVDSFIKTSRTTDLRLAQKLFFPWTRDSLKDTYLTAVTQTFRSDPQALDFLNSRCASDVINNWCASETNGHIRNIVNAGDFSSYTSLVVASAVYFKGSWQNKFDPRYTEFDRFYSPTGIKTISFMYRQSTFYTGYLRDMNARFIELPYAGVSISMFIVLPDPGVHLDYVAKRLEEFPPQRFFETGEPSEVDLYLPKFTIRSTFDLVEILKNMGLTAIFYNPDFSHMSDSTVKLSKIVHMAFIEVNEFGSTASAASVGVVEDRMWSSPIEIKADRPFLFYITTTDLKGESVTIFSGRYNGD